MYTSETIFLNDHSYFLLFVRWHAAFLEHFHLEISIIQNFNHTDELVIHYEIFDFVEKRDV